LQASFGTLDRDAGVLPSPKPCLHQSILVMAIATALLSLRSPKGRGNQRDDGSQAIRIPSWIKGLWIAAALLSLRSPKGCGNPRNVGVLQTFLNRTAAP
jgi:hypothetical protein